MNDQEYPLPPTAPLESRTGREPVPQYLPTFGRAALLLFDVPALPAARANPAGLAAAVLTGPSAVVPAGGAVAFPHRNGPPGRPAEAAALRPDRNRP